MQSRRTAQIAYLDSHELHAVTSELVAETRSRSLQSRVRLWLLKHLFSLDEGIIYAFALKERLFSARLYLESLKREGYIEAYGEGAVFADYPRLNIAGVVAKRGEGTIWNWGYTLPGEEKALALRTAAYEAMERSASYYVPDSARPEEHPFEMNDATDLFAHIPHPRTTMPKESPLVRHAEDLGKTLSIRLQPLTGGRARYIPAHCLYWGQWFSQIPGLIQEPNTSGSGGGATREAALLSALLELIERDTFLLHWYASVPPPEIVLDPNTPFGQMIGREGERYNLRTRFFSTTYDVPVPVCVCLITDPVLNIVAYGAKAHASAEEALRGAYAEALATLYLLRERSRFVAEDTLRLLLKDPALHAYEVDRVTRVNLYCSPLGLRTVEEHWVKPGHQISFESFQKLSFLPGSPRDHLARLLRVFEGLVQTHGEGYHVYAHAFDSPWIRRERSAVAHVFVPALLKLHLYEIYAALVSPRISAFAESHGKPLKSEAEISYLPHPFP